MTLRAANCLLLALLVPMLIVAVLLAQTEVRRDGAGDREVAVTLADLQELSQANATSAELVGVNAKAANVHVAAVNVTDVHATDVHVTDVYVTEVHTNAAVHADDDAAYLPPSQLTERPQVLRDIVSEWALPPLPDRLNCVLLINEYGDVDRVLFDPAPLTPAQQNALRDRLLLARFTPGRLYGRPVKTALTIEVRLD